MALGNPVNAQTLNYKAAEAVLALREAFEKIENVAKWLDNQNVDPDPLETVYSLTEDEAYVLRVYFQTMNGVKTANQTTLDLGRKITNLE